MFAFNMLILLQHGMLGAAIAAMLVGLGAAGYRAYAASQHRHQSLTLVHEFVTGGVGAQSLEALAEVLLSRIRRLLRASTVQVMIVDGDGDGDVIPSEVGSALTLAVDEEDSLHVGHHDFDTGDWVVVRTLTQQEPLLARRTTKDPGVRHWLDDHEFRDAMMVALPDSSGLRGTLRVTDRLGETSTFSTEDLTMLQTLTGHLAVALRSTRLVQKLGYDADHDSLTGLVNRRACTPTGSRGWPRRPAGAGRCCCWTLTSSRRSTTAWATTPGTSSWSRWGPGCAGSCAAGTCWRAWAAMSSRSCSRTPAPRRPPASPRTCARGWRPPRRRRPRAG